MEKLIAAGVSLLLSLGAAGLLQDQPEPPAPPAPPAPPEPPKPAVKKDQRRVEVEIHTRLDESPADPNLALNEAYNLLLRLRSERLDDRSKQLVDQATELYRNAVRSITSEDNEARQRASNAAVAARSLAQTVERLRDLQRAARPDSDLPPPPVIIRQRMLSQTGPEPPQVPLPPPIPGRPGAPAPPPPPPGPDRVDVRITNPDVAKKAGELFRRYRVQTSDQELTELRERLKKAEEAAREIRARAERTAREAMKKAGEDATRKALVEIAPRVAVSSGFLGLASPQAVLRNAYDRITEAREKYKGNERASLYLDAARDLYNAARRDAEAGRMERAIELARAAEALTHVPTLVEGGPLEARPDREPSRPRRDGDQPEPPRRGDRPEARGERDEARGDRPEARAEERPRERERDRDREREREGRPEARPEREREREGRPEARAERERERPEGREAVEGIGVALKVDEGKVIVVSILEGGPAAKDGRLKPGDEIVGLKRDDQSEETFRNRPLEEIVELLRGPAGSKVRLVVISEGTEESKVYELTRERLNLPRPHEPTESSRIQLQIDEALKELQRAIPVFPGQDESLPPPIPEGSH